MALACASSQRPEHIAAPQVSAGLAHEVFFGSSDSAPATIAVRIRNNADVAIMVTSVEVDSAGNLEWGLLRQTRMFRAAIEPKTVKDLSFDATAVRLVERRREPLSFNVRVQFEAEGKHWQQFVRVMGANAPL
jgi:hypothetical protein